MSSITREALADLAEGIGMEQSAFADRYLHDAEFHAVCRKAVSEHAHALTLTDENAELKADLAQANEARRCAEDAAGIESLKCEEAEAENTALKERIEKALAVLDDAVMLTPRLKGMPRAWLLIMRAQLAEATARTGVHFVLRDESLEVVEMRVGTAAP